MTSPVGLVKPLIVLALLGASLLGVQAVLAGPPVASFTVTPPPGGCGAFTFTSTSTDPEGDADIQATDWDFAYDGTFDTAASGSPVMQTFGTPGSRQVALRVRDLASGDDTTEDESTAAQQVDVANTGLPNAAFSASPNPAGQNQTVTFNAAASSDSGGGSIVKYEWDLDGNAANGFEVDSGGTPSASRAYVGVGFHSVTLKVTDDCGAVDTASGGVVVNNATPTASFTISPKPAAIGQTVTFNGAASADPDGSIVKYEWDLDGNTANGFEVDTGATSTATKQYTGSGTFGIRLRVTDNDGATATDFDQLRVNAKPTASFAATPNPALIGEAVSFDASASSDPDGGIGKYEWDLDGNGSYETNSGAVPTATKTYTGAGTVQVKLRVTDSDNATAEITRPVTVQQTRPNADLEFSPANPLPGQAVTLVSKSSPSASPGTPQLTDIQWDFNYSPFANFSPDAVGPSAITSFAAPGTYTVAIRVTETGGGFAIKYVTIVVNAAPQAGFSFNPTRPVEGQQVTFVSTATDPDGPLAAQQWDLDNDGQFDDGQGAVVSTNKLKRGNHTVKLRVTDAKGAEAIATGAVAVRAKPLKPPVDVKRSIGYARRDWGVVLVGLIVRVPSKTTVTVACKGRGCPRGKLVKRSGKKAARLRFDKLKGSVRAGAKITVTTARPGHMVAFDTYLIRGKKRKPLLKERCKLTLRDKQPRPCP